MIRLFYIATLLAIIAITFTPTFDAVLSHHGKGEIPHTTQDDDCGCVCHMSADAVITAETIEIHFTVTRFEHNYCPFPPDPLAFTIDRPPELFS